MIVSFSKVCYTAIHHLKILTTGFRMLSMGISRITKLIFITCIVIVFPPEIKAQKSLLDTMLAGFPAGTVSGAPKIRAMEIIDELEPVERNVYCGAIGYFGFNGNMKTSIPIRTMIIKNNKGYFHVGGGIVYDSSPSMEYQETLDKAKGFFKVLNIID